MVCSVPSRVSHVSSGSVVCRHTQFTEDPVYARVFVYVPHRCRSLDCLRNLDHSCARRFGGHTAIERISSGRGPMNCRLTTSSLASASRLTFELDQNAIDR